MLKRLVTDTQTDGYIYEHSLSSLLFFTRRSEGGGGSEGAVFKLLSGCYNRELKRNPPRINIFGNYVFRKGTKITNDLRMW